MVDPIALSDELLAKLRALPDVGERIYDGYVPDKVPEAGGYVRPYALVMSGLGTDLPAERDLSKLTDIDVLDWHPQVNAVGATARQCRQVAHQISQALTNTWIGGGWLQPDEDAFRVNTPVLDDQVTPARFFLPLPWRTITN